MRETFMSSLRRFVPLGLLVVWFLGSACAFDAAVDDGSADAGEDALQEPDLPQDEDAPDQDVVPDGPDLEDPQDVEPPPPDEDASDAQEDADDPDPPDLPMIDCSRDEDCDDGVACTVDACVDGVCAQTVDDTRCQDDNPCTDGFCTLLDGCVQTPNSAPCDDGLFCNGADTCRQGECAGHAGDPCGELNCEEDTDRCLGCLDDADCPGEQLGPPDVCVSDGDVCSTSGVSSRTRTRYSCANGSCVAAEDTITEPCVRDTDGHSCGQNTEGQWSECEYDSFCSQQGQRERTNIAPTCRSGACVNVVDTQTEACARDTEGTMCQDTTIGDWSECEYNDLCVEDGERSRITIVYTCRTGECRGRTTPEQEMCSRDTNGVQCTDCDAMSCECQQGQCDEVPLDANVCEQADNWRCEQDSANGCVAICGDYTITVFRSDGPEANCQTPQNQTLLCQPPNTFTCDGCLQVAQNRCCFP
mgnify:CR=1 FL=1